MATLTSKVVTVWAGREAGLEALAQALIGVGLFTQYDFLFNSGGLEIDKAGKIFPRAPELTASDVKEFLADWINLGFPAFQARYSPAAAALLGKIPLEVRYPAFLDVLHGPVDILTAQLEGRALRQDSGRYWIDGHRRVRSTRPES